MALGVHRVWCRDLRRTATLPPTATAPAPGSQDELKQCIQRIANMGAAELTDWKVLVELIVHKTSADRTLHRVRLLSDAPSKTFHVLQMSILEGDDNLPALLDSMKKFAVKTQVSIEGQQVRLGDFKIRLGRIIQANHPVAMVLDIEYLPCSTYHNADKILALEELAADINELVKTVSSPPGSGSSTAFTSFQPLDSTMHKKFNLGDEVTWSHYVIDYILAATFGVRRS